MHEFTKIVLLSETHRRPIGDLLETDMPDRRPRHASTETLLKLTCPQYIIPVYININKQKEYKNKNI